MKRKRRADLKRKEDSEKIVDEEMRGKWREKGNKVGRR